MTIHLPPEIERSIQAAVHSGHFASVDDAMTEAASMLLERLRQREHDEEARDLTGIRQGLDDMRAGRTEPLAEAFADIRRDLTLPHGS